MTNMARDDKGLVHTIVQMIGSEQGRPLRFIGTGAVAGTSQLILLALLTKHGWNANLAAIIAFLLAAQVNFACSSFFTWRGRETQRSLGKRWLMFHGSIAGMAVVNFTIYLLARQVLPVLLAAVAGILVAAVGNFLIGDRIVFKHNGAALSPQASQPAA